MKLFKDNPRIAGLVELDPIKSNRMKAAGHSQVVLEPK